MSINYPTALDTTTTLPSISPTDTMNQTGKEHDTMHSNLADAVRALEAKVGMDTSADPTSIDYKVAHLSGTKTWFGNGAPAAFHNDGDLYFDTSVATFKGYVQGAGILPTALQTIATGVWSSTNASSATFTSSNSTTLMMLALCYEGGPSGNTSVVTSPHLTWTKYTSNYSNYTGRQHYIDFWYAQPTVPLTGEVVSWTLTSVIDDASWFLIPVTASIVGSDPFYDIVGSNLPASVASNASEVNTLNITAPTNTLLLQVLGRDDTTQPGSSTGFTLRATSNNGGASRYEYTTLSTLAVGTPFNSTITSVGLAGSCGSMIVVAIANNPTYRSWQSFA
jgi:hypothetical protein